MSKYFFGSKIKKIRIENDLSIVDVSKLFLQHSNPVSPKTIYKWEKDIVIPDLEQFATLANIYNTSLSGLLNNQKSLSRNLTEHESEFIEMLRYNATYKKIVVLLSKKEREEQINENRNSI